MQSVSWSRKRVILQLWSAHPASHDLTPGTSPGAHPAEEAWDCVSRRALTVAREGADSPVQNSCELSAGQGGRVLGPEGMQRDAASPISCFHGSVHPAIPVVGQLGEKNCFLSTGRCPAPKQMALGTLPHPANFTSLCRCLEISPNLWIGWSTLGLCLLHF